LRLIKPLIQMIWPTRCCVCQAVNPEVICSQCASRLEVVGRCCTRCGRRRMTEFKSPDCRECFGMNIGVSRARSLFVYNEPARSVLSEFKYRGNIGAGQWLAERLAKWAAVG